MSETFLNTSIELHCGDCLDVLAILAENSIDSCCTDPPYHLTSIVKRFGKDGSAPAQFGSDGRFQRVSRGFMSKEWDGGDIAQSVDLWRQVYRVLKPGAHLLAFGGTRTYHHMACAIEDAGFEIRDCIQWLYGSGFPKSHDVSKGIDRAAGAERETIGIRQFADGTMARRTAGSSGIPNSGVSGQSILTAPATPAARQWEGWGTALKPACEPIVLARKPLSEKTVAANVLRWGTGAINVDACRVETELRPLIISNRRLEHNTYGPGLGGSRAIGNTANGRWPANVIHDGSEEVLAGFPDVDGAAGKASGPTLTGESESNSRGKFNGVDDTPFYGDTGSAARFFYTAKADSNDRIGSKHPTVKPLDLMQYLVRLVTPKGGTVLDPFAGTGTTGEAAWREGTKAILIEREEEYHTDIRRRMELCLAGPDERAFKAQKAKQIDKPLDYGPLFAGVA